MASAAELQADLWTLDSRELLRRPLEIATAIDPANPAEIDDAITLEDKGEGIYRVAVHVADAGLLLGSSDLIDEAREKGWTRYGFGHAKDGGSPVHDLMLSPAIGLEKLGLDQNHGGLGAPAITISFNFDSNLRRVLELDVYKSRVLCHVTTYDNFNWKLKRGRKYAHDMLKVARLVNQDIDTPSEFSESTRASDVVGELMVAANRLIAEEMRKHNIPWLYRNHQQRLPTRLKELDASEAAITLNEMLDALGRGRYSPTPLRHEGLNLLPYSHFTSPLRRFADLVNHLTLHALLTGKELPFSFEELEIIGDELAFKTARDIGLLAREFAEAA